MPDILIRGMKMPTSCGRCRFAGVCGVHPVDEWPDLESIITNDVIGVDGERDKGCPLVPLLPHGDLIDRDEFVKSQCNSCDGSCECVECDCLNCEQSCRCDMIVDAMEAPVVVPAERGEG